MIWRISPTSRVEKKYHFEMIKTRQRGSERKNLDVDKYRK